MADYWERIPGETDKSWYAFQIYRDLPVNAPEGDTRSLAAVARKLNYKDEQMCGRWSAKYRWVERARAYDRYKEQTAMVVREVGLQQYEQAVYEKLTMNLAMFDVLAGKTMAAYMAMDFVESKELLRLIQALKIKDDLARRAAGMPIEFKVAEAEDTHEENATYILGEPNA